jgi:hypothetical protein
LKGYRADGLQGVPLFKDGDKVKKKGNVNTDKEERTERRKVWINLV